MSGKSVEKACRVAHPRAALNPTGINGVYRIAVTNASQSIAVPLSLRARFLKLKLVSPAGTTSVQYGVSKAAAGQTIVLNQLSALGTGHASAGGTIFPNSSEDALIEQDVTFLNFIGSATEASCFLEIFVSEVPA
jgi:hypothetical protein